MTHINDEDGAVCTGCGDTVNTPEDWDKNHRHGR